MTPDPVVPEEVKEVKKEKTPEELVEMFGLVRSKLPVFNKKKEFIVLKGHVFHIQSVSPKKIILKFKEKMNNFEPIPDGIFHLED